MNKFFIISFSIVFISMSCKKDEVNQENSNTLKLVWSQEVEEVEEVDYVFTFNPVIYDDIVIYSWHTTTPKTNPIVAYNKSTGEKVWEWADFFSNPEYIGSGSKRTYVYDNILVLTSTYGNLYAVDMNTGETYWKIAGVSTRHQIRGYENKILTVSQSIEEPDDGIYMIDVLTGDYEKIYDLERGENQKISSNPPILYKNETGEYVFFTTYTLYETVSSEGISHSLFYNIDHDSIILEADEMLHSLGYENYKGKIYGGVGEGTKIRCYDNESLQLIWEKEASGGIGQGGLTFVGEKLIHGSGTLEVICRDVETGEILWKSPSTFLTSPFEHYEGRIYYSNNGLAVLDLETGQSLAVIASPNSIKDNNVFFDTALSIDKETGRVYSADYRNALCYEPYGH
jgi:outer membrane protein assembly factor BamB